MTNMKKTFHRDLYKDVFKKSPMGIYTINKGGFIETFNPKMMRLSGAKRLSDIVGLNVLTLPSYKKAGLDKFFRKALKGEAFKTEVEYVSYTAKKMSYRKYQGTPIYGKDRKVERVLLMVEDITKDKLLQVEVNNLAKFPSENPFPVFRFSTDGKVVYVNDAGENMLKFWKKTEQSRVPKHVKQFIEQSLDTNEIQSSDFHIQETTMSLLFVPVLDEDYVNVYGRDVTAERAVNKMRYEFVSIASHQLQTPLTALRWNSELLLNEKMGLEQKDIAIDIHQSASDLSDLVTDLIDVSWIETGGNILGEKQSVNIVKIINNIVAESAEGARRKNVNIVIGKKTPSTANIKIDSLKVKSALMNLVDNAIKYSKEGGSVTIDCVKRKKNLLISIKDNGVGIPLKQQKRIFEKFFRASNASLAQTSGTGLGLYIAKAIIESNGGEIWFKSAAGKGTTFFVSLPL